MIYEKLSAVFKKTGETVFDGHLFPRAGDPAWEQIPDAYMIEIQNMQAELHDVPYPMRLLTDFLAFVETGSRVQDEEPYFLRRRKLCAAVLAACTGDGTAFRDVLDGIWCICEESSWVISAHNINPVPGAPEPRDRPVPDAADPYVDLFAAQTGMILALTSDLLQDRLDAVSPLLRERIHGEIMKRILVPFMKRDDFWWMGILRKDLCNWTPWIISNVLTAACLEMADQAELSGLVLRSGEMLDRWLWCMPEDGGCDEGAGYWNMAGGALLDCLEIYDAVTGGEAVFWDEPLIRNILSFPAKAEIGGGWFINFADCDARPFLSGERIQAAGEYLRDDSLASLGLRMRGSLEDELSDVPHFSRLLKKLFHPAGEIAGKSAETVHAPDVWLPDLEVRIVRRAGVTLAIKGGDNGENHNHNDVGSFMLYMDDEPVIVDAGNMTYTAKTFSRERYTLWNVRSAYHNLPMIGGHEQLPGGAYAAASLSSLPDGLILDLAKTYDSAAGLDELERRALLRDDGMLCLQDRISLRVPQTVTWVFMLREKPELTRPELVTQSLRMSFPPACTVAVEEIKVEDTRMQSSFPGCLYRVMISLPAAMKFDCEFTVRRNDFRE